jgi:ectoine hydroxylase-related dioxygenase (phytanoyl-CoA dioxygenase family)
MAFQFSDQHLDEYHTQGYTVFRAILPPALIGDLRRVTDRARALAREKHGPQAQRLQPVAAHDLDPTPFDAFRALSELRAAIAALLSPRHAYGSPEILGVLLEPADLPYCTAWHRDWRDNVRHLDRSDWEARFRDPDYFNQLNAALYEDDCTWIVPGSHLRSDLPREMARFPERPPRGPDLEGRSYEERERLCLEYCESMPGAVRLRLNAGDCAIYRNTLWHLGTYLPYRKRATLHDAVETPEYAAWWRKQRG